MTTDTTDYSPIVTAARALLSACDGALEHDGQGFNKPDSMRVRGLLANYALTANDLRDLWERLRKYTGQLAGFGIDYAALPEPPVDRDALADAVGGPVEVVIGTPPHESTKLVKMPFGKFVGRTLYELATDDSGRSYLGWLAREARDERTRAIAQATLDGEAVEVAEQAPPERPKLFKANDKLLAVSFPYDPRVVDLLKAHVDGRKWNGSLKRWELPLHMAPKLVDLVFGGPDKIDMDTASAAAYYSEKARREALDETRAKSDTRVEVPGLLLPLRDYQNVGVEFGLRAGGRVGIFDRMGLGKTPQGIALALALPAKKVLVLTLASLTANWKREILKFAGLDACMWNTAGHKGDLDARFHVTNYDTLLLRPSVNVRYRNPKRKNQCQHQYKGEERYCESKVVPKGAPVVPMYCAVHAKEHGRRTVEDFSEAVYYEILRQGYDMVIADECHVLSNRESLRSQAVYGATRAADKELYPGFDTRYLCELTATAMQNRPAELFPLVNWIDMSRFPSFFHYANKYGAWTDSGAWTGQNRPTKPQNLDDLHDRIKDIVIRRGRDAVKAELPPCSENDFTITLTDAQRREYTKLLKAVMGEWAASKKPSMTQMVVIEDYLRQIKLPIAWELLQAQMDDERAAILFSTRLDPLRETLQKFGERACYIDGSLSGEKRLEIVDRIQEGRADILCAGLRSGGVGLNITRPDLALMLDLDWNPQAHEQAKGRIDRIGQQNPSQILYLVAEGTTDEIKKAILEDKLKTAEAALDGKVSARKRKKTYFKDFVRQMKRQFKELSDIDENSIPDDEEEAA